MPIEKGENYKHISQFTEQTKEEADLPVPPSYLLNATVEDDLDHEYQEKAKTIHNLVKCVNSDRGTPLLIRR